MATGKLSNRQKMINMMYLVLMALLALNVSVEILDAFENLKNKLAKSAELYDDQNKNFAGGMKDKIAKELRDGKSYLRGLPDSLDLIRARTASIVSLIDNHLDTMHNYAGPNPETGEYEKKGEREANLQYWMGQGPGQQANDGRGSGKAINLKDSIISYYTWLDEISSRNVSKKNRDSMRLGIPKLEASTRQGSASNALQNKTWERVTFEGPVVANMAALEALKLDLYAQEKGLFDILGARLGLVKFKPDKVTLVEAPVSSIVPAGLKYQTKLFVVMSSSKAKPRFSSSSGKLENKEKDGINMGILTIGANGSNIPKGKKEGKQRYSFSATVPKATGGSVNISEKGEFTVRKPEIVVTSAAIQNLYRACANTINIDVPALGELYNPKISASGAQVIPSTKSKKKFVIVPSGKKCIVGVSSNTNGQTLKLGTVNYNVVKPPKPTLSLKVNGKDASGAIPVKYGSSITVQVISDPEFRALLPKDARYAIGKIEVLAALSLGPPKRVNTLNGGNAMSPIRIRLGSRLSQARKGTKVFIRIDNVSRRNFQGKSIKDNRFTRNEKMFSVTLK